MMEILIVEDDFLSRSILNKMLVEMGHTVIEAENGAQAWEILKTNGLRIVISDWIMPGFNGLELCEKIRSEPSLEYIYIIIVTAKDHRADLVEVFRAGADDYIPKPFDPDELRARVMPGLRVVDLEERRKLLTRTLFESRNKQRIGIDSLEYEIRRLSEQLVKTSSRIEAHNNDLKNSFKDEIDLSYIMEDITGLISDCLEGTDRIKKIVMDLKAFSHPGEGVIQ